MKKVLQYPLKVLHSAFLVLIFPFMTLECALAWCIRYKLFCDISEWFKIFVDAMKDIWRTA